MLVDLPATLDMRDPSLILDTVAFIGFWDSTLLPPSPLLIGYFSSLQLGVAVP